MPVASSSYAADARTQVDGWRYVTETHTLTAGAPVLITYLAAPGADYAAIMASRVAWINAKLAEDELDTLLDGPWSLNHQTAAELAARVRARYQSATRDEACKMAWWVIERINAGNITDAQCYTAFGLTSQQWNQFKNNRLNPQHDAWAAVRSATGA